MLLKDPTSKPSNDFDLPGVIGERLSRKRLKKKDARKIPAKVAANFFETMLSSFHDFKQYCNVNKESSDCAVLDTDKSVLLDALNEYYNMFHNQDGMYTKALGL